MAEDITNETLRQIQADLADLKARMARVETALAEMNDVLGAVVDRLEELEEKE